MFKVNGKEYSQTIRTDNFSYRAGHASRWLGGIGLREITQTLLDLRGVSIEDVMPGIDALKLKSSMTLFDAVCPGDVFASVLDKYYEGMRDRRTLEMISSK